MTESAPVVGKADLSHTWQPYCPHGTPGYIVCSKCEERRVRQLFEERSLAVFEKLTGALERLESKLTP